MAQAKRRLSRKAAKKQRSRRTTAAHEAAPARQMETIAEDDLDDEATQANQAAAARDQELGAAKPTAVATLGRKAPKRAGFRNPDLLAPPRADAEAKAKRTKTSSSAAKAKKVSGPRGSAGA